MCLVLGCNIDIMGHIWTVLIFRYCADYWRNQEAVSFLFQFLSMKEKALKNLWGSVGTGPNCVEYYEKWAETYDEVGNVNTSRDK